MKSKSLLVLSIVASSILATGCQSTGEEYKASVYKADQLNQKQEAKTINIIAIIPAKVEVDNTREKDIAVKAGAILGGIAGALIGSNQGSDGALIGGAAGGVTGGVAGSMVDDKVLVDGVSITYSEKNKIYTSTQVGQACEYKPGVALVISTNKNETRVQPNSSCPVKK